MFDDGRLGDALQACAQEVKSAPDDPARRTFYFELLLFAGDLDRAERQLDVIAHRDAQTEAAVQVYRNLLFAEAQRRKVFAGDGQPEFLCEAPPYAHLHLEALQALRDGQGDVARERLETAAAERTVIAGTINGKPFDGLRDCDDVVGPFLELIIVRSYAWLPFEHIRELEVSRPERPRDLVWAPVRLVLNTGAQHRGYVPVLYDRSHTGDRDDVRLGRFTDWEQLGDGPVRGKGHRMLLVGDEGYPLLEIRTANLRGAAH